MYMYDIYLNIKYVHVTVICLGIEDVCMCIYGHISFLYRLVVLYCIVLYCFYIDFDHTSQCLIHLQQWLLLEQSGNTVYLALTLKAK